MTRELYRTYPNAFTLQMLISNLIIHAASGLYQKRRSTQMTAFILPLYLSSTISVEYLS